MSDKIELEKLELEKEKVKLERFKAWWTGISIIVPLIATAITIIFGIWSQSKHEAMQAQIQDEQAKHQLEAQIQNAKLQYELQSQQAKDQFEIKAAEIVMNAPSPLGAHTKAKALANLFPSKLPNNFASSFNPILYSKPVTTYTKRANKKNRVQKLARKRRNIRRWNEIIN